MSIIDRLDLKTLEKILAYLWLTDVPSLLFTCKRLHGIVKCESFGLHKLLQYTGFLYRDPFAIRASELALTANDMGAAFGYAEGFLRTNPGLDLFLFCRRLSSWPTGIDTNSLVHEPRNVSILRFESRPGALCAVYGGRRKESHKGYTVVASDDHFPCLPGAFTQPRHKNEGEMQAWERLPRVELQKTKKQSVVCRCLTPFARVLRLPRDPLRRVATLTCIAYFEVIVHLNQGYSAMDDIRRFSVGLACSLFPLRKKQLGYDNYSFAYHRDGSFFHGNRNCCGHMAAYSPGDTVGCGLVYPPLAGANRGRIFFSKNGEVVGIFDMGVCGLLSLPWFPAMVSALAGLALVLVFVLVIVLVLASDITTLTLYSPLNNTNNRALLLPSQWNSTLAPIGRSS